MNKRQTVPRDTERRLWAEAIGHCMNPECQDELLAGEVNVGEMAHIVPHEERGDVSFENLILLCRRCHTLTDRKRTEETVVQLQGWKRNRNREVNERFAKRFTSFEKLKESIVPLLARNATIFYNYGPDKADPNNEERHNMWLKFEAEIISNNQRMQLMLGPNQHLIHKGNRPLVDTFIAHAREFVETRDDDPIQRVLLFPQDFLSIFGLGPAEHRGLVSNVSALQNFITDLVRTGKFVDLYLESEQTLIYRENDKEVFLDLNDSPHINQIYYSGRYYRPETTKVRLGGLVFFLKWLSGNNINFVFDDISNLTELTLNDSHKVKLCYAYCLSVSDLHQFKLDDGLIVVNLHTWNGAPITEEAHKYASGFGVRLFSQNDFFKYAHRNIK